MEYYSQLTNCFNSIHYDFLIVKNELLKKTPLLTLIYTNIYKSKKFKSATRSLTLFSYGGVNLEN
jgi:deoxyribodipyrimidine photolyase-like uncharacterized protein